MSSFTSGTVGSFTTISEVVPTNYAIGLLAFELNRTHSGPLTHAQGVRWIV